MPARDRRNARRAGCALGKANVTILPVTRLIAIFVAVALLLGNGTAIAQAMCQHATLEAHAIAKSSGDERIASSATAEEMAQHAAAKSGTVTDAPGAFAAAVLPADTAELNSATFVRVVWPANGAKALARRVIAPPERPPLH